MSRRSLFLLVILLVFGMTCAAKVSRQGRVIVFAMEEIHRKGLHDVGRQKLLEGALEGMTSRLDPYSAYLAPDMVEGFREPIDQEFSGIGVEIILDPKTEQLMVASPLFDAPAYRAGIRAGDRILQIDGKSTQGLSLEDARRRMRGRAKEPVTLTVLHPGDDKPVDIEIVRDVIQVASVLGDTRKPDGSWDYFLEGRDRIGYVRINVFGRETVEELQNVLRRLVEQGMRGLVLDLRNNSGGRLDAAIDICDLLVASGEIVTMRGRHGRILRAYQATGNAPFTDFPLAVLVNQATASASEIVAACLQDHERAVVVGQRTYGKGTVQEIIDLRPSQGELKLTTASYWRPSGRNIHREPNAGDSDAWGVRPDPGYEVRAGNAEPGRPPLVRRDLRKLPAGQSPEGPQEAERFSDPQLDRAVEYLEEALRSQQKPTTP